MKPLPILICSVFCCLVCFAASRPAAQLGNSRMKKQIIRTTDAPNQSLLYSQAVKVGSTIFVTGTLGIDPKTKQPAGTTIQEQTRQALVNCRNILRAAGATLEDVVEVQVLLARPDDFAGLNEAYAKFFPIDPPTRTTARLGPELPNLLVSIGMTAVLGAGQTDSPNLPD